MNPHPCRSDTNSPAYVPEPWGLDQLIGEADAFVRFLCGGFQQLEKLVTFAKELLERKHNGVSSRQNQRQSPSKTGASDLLSTVSHRDKKSPFAEKRVLLGWACEPAGFRLGRSDGRLTLTREHQAPDSAGSIAATRAVGQQSKERFSYSRIGFHLGAGK